MKRFKTTIVLIVAILFGSISMYAQHGSKHSFTYSAGVTFHKKFESELPYFTHKFDYTYWLKPYMGVEGGIRMDKEGRACPQINGYGTINGYPNSEWQGSSFLRFSIDASLNFVTPMLKFGENFGIYAYADPGIVLALPVSFMGTTIYYSNGDIDYKTTTAKSQFIFPELDAGITLRFKHFSISPGYSITMYDPYSGRRNMTIGESKVSDYLEPFDKFYNSLYIKFTIH